MPVEIIEDTDDLRVLRESGKGWESYNIEPKAGTPLANEEDLRQRSRQALQANDAFLAISVPTNAQTLAQVKALTRECSALIRLLLNQVDTTAGT